ncbi:glycosyltransferase [Gordonia lacunae]|uniref:glycosyltransferase n=1 Tax=Gordonia lacunae TaxID=417102 RepID=UPI0039E50BF4
MNVPEISVLLPYYNAEATLADAIDSVLAQQGVDFELILIDDGSTDSSSKVAGRYHNDPRVVAHSHANMGLAATLNVGIELARAAIVARMDADDIARPGRLRSQVAYLNVHPEVNLVGGQINRCVDGVVDSQSNFPLEHSEIVTLLRVGGHALSHPAIAFRTEAARRVGGYWGEGVAEDWDFYLKMAETGRVANLPEVVLDYRFHDAGINAENMRLVRTNIALATENHRRRVSDRAELSATDFRTNTPLALRIRIESETRSLTAYRRGLRTAGTRRLMWLSIASVMGPQFAARRLLSNRHQRER